MSQSSRLAEMKTEKQVPSAPASPESDYPYENIHVLMINWWLDNTETMKQLKQLSSIFETLLNYPAPEIYSIPQHQSHHQLRVKIEDFISKYARPENLLIVCYTGPGGYDHNLNFNISPEPFLSRITISWTTHQRRLEAVPCDILILLDSSESVGASFGPVNAIHLRHNERQLAGSRKEMIATCNSINDTPAPTGTSFHDILISELERRGESGRQFTVADLHRGMVERLLETR